MHYKNFPEKNKIIDYFFSQSGGGDTYLANRYRSNCYSAYPLLFAAIG